jgi:hypothetical protein
MALRNLKDFTSSINSRGVLKTNKYIALISFGSNHYMSSRPGAVNSDDANLFSVRCDSVQLPGMSIASADGPPRLGYGPVQKHPYNISFEDISLTFIVDANSRVHKMLYDWTNCIVNYNGGGGKNLTGAIGPIGANAYEVGYKNKFATNLIIEVYRDDGQNGLNNKAMTYTAFDAYPMAFPSVGLNWTDGEILRLNIPFSYTDYSIQYA